LVGWGIGIENGVATLSKKLPFVALTGKRKEIEASAGAAGSGDGAGAGLIYLTFI